MIQIDESSPVPIYHQIVEAIRYQVATGRIRAGDRLPAAKAAAEQWGVHLHTVRRAYGELAREGLVEVKRPQGTRVLPLGKNRAAAGTVPANLGAFLEKTVRHARKEFGLTAQGLGEWISRIAAPSLPRGAGLTVVECNEPQAEDYARQLAASWSLQAGGWSLEREGDPPEGPIISTYFHYNEIRARWPHRARDIHFVAVKPDPSIATRVLKGARPSRKTTVVLCEVDLARGHNVSVDLMELLPPSRCRLVVKVVGNPRSILAKTAGPVLFAPRNWAKLSAVQRNNPRAYQLRYVFESEAITALIHSLRRKTGDSSVIRQFG